MVNEARDVTARVPLHNIEVQLVGEALGRFLARPTYLVRLVSKRPHLLNCLILFLLMYNVYQCWIEVTYLSIRLFLFYL